MVLSKMVFSSISVCSCEIAGQTKKSTSQTAGYRHWVIFLPTDELVKHFHFVSQIEILCEPVNENCF